MDAEKSYLFICGCARSGTSTTAGLVQAHPKTAFGRERFNLVFKKNTSAFNDSLFEKERFCKDLRPEDAHFDILDKYYNDLYDRWDTCTYYGDKVPSLFKNYNYLFETFPKCKVIFLLRNIMDVCQSWENRRLKSFSSDDKWPLNNGILEAVPEWNLAIKDTLEALNTWSDQIFVLQYEDLYGKDELLESIFGFLELEITDEVLDIWNRSKIRANNLEQKRTLKFTSEQKRRICRTANFSDYTRLIDRISKA